MGNPRNDTAGHALWDFSLAVYARDAVHTECLDLQEQHGVDVNLLLFCAWIGAERGVTLDEAALTRACTAIEAWQRDVIAPIRSARRSARRLGRDEVHASMLRVELEAERIAQDMLFALGEQASRNATTGRAARKAAARDNLHLLLARSPVTAPFPRALLQAASADAS